MKENAKNILTIKNIHNEENILIIGEYFLSKKLLLMQKNRSTEMAIASGMLSNPVSFPYIFQKK